MKPYYSNEQNYSPASAYRDISHEQFEYCSNLKKDPDYYCDFFEIGDKAPDFTLPAVVKGNESTVSLADFRGKWVVLFFYSSDFTFL